MIKCQQVYETLKVVNLLILAKLISLPGMVGDTVLQLQHWGKRSMTQGHPWVHNEFLACLTMESLFEKSQFCFLTNKLIYSLYSWCKENNLLYSWLQTQHSLREINSELYCRLVL